MVLSFSLCKRRNGVDTNAFFRLWEPLAEPADFRTFEAFMSTFRVQSTPVTFQGVSLGGMDTAVGMQAWAESHRDAWTQSLKGLRRGNLKTSEIRNGARIDTTLETIAERVRDLAELAKIAGER